MNITVEIARSATPELLAALNKLLPQLSSSAPPLAEPDLDAVVGSESSTLFVARRDGEVVGVLTLVVFAIPSGRRAWIEDVVVDEHARGLGVGQALTMAAVDEARHRQVRSIELTSRPSREAANLLYQKLGFAPRSTNVYRLPIEGS